MSQTGNQSTLEQVANIEAIRARLQGRVEDFHILLSDDGLILCGRAHSFHAKQLAQHAVMESFEMPIFANQIKVG